MTDSTVTIEEHVSELTDPQRREPVDPLMDIVVMTWCAVISGADDFVSIATWARNKREWLEQFLDLSHGGGGPDNPTDCLGALSTRGSMFCDQTEENVCNLKAGFEGIAPLEGRPICRASCAYGTQTILANCLCHPAMECRDNQHGTASQFGNQESKRRRCFRAPT